MKSKQANALRDTFEVVLVSYRSRRHIEELLARWAGQVLVVIVDNSSNSDGVAEFALNRPECRYIDGGGQGFARAANLGALSSRCPIAVFVNPDTRPTVDDLRRLAAGVLNDPGAASHAATVISPDGEVEVGVGGWEPTVPRALVHSVGLHRRWRNSGLFALPRIGESCEPDWTTGACMAVPLDVFRRLEGFDEMFFVYSEDVSYGRRARLRGYRQVLRPDIRVRHGAGSSGAPSREMFRLRGASFSYYMTSYHSRPRAVVVLGATVVGYLLRILVAFRHDRALVGHYIALIEGMMTRTAKVSGVEVARARFREFSHT